MDNEIVWDKEKYVEEVKEVLAKQITIYEEIKGELIECDFGNRLHLKFKDGSWAMFVAFCEEDGGSGMYLIEDDPELYDLWTSGLISQEVHDKQVEYERILDSEKEEMRALNAYKRLKKRFEKK